VVIDGIGEVSTGRAKGVVRELALSVGFMFVVKADIAKGGKFALGFLLTIFAYVFNSFC
jgi:hypothetical protein